MLIGAFVNGCWIERAVIEFDGWIGLVCLIDVVIL